MPKLRAILKRLSVKLSGVVRKAILWKDLLAWPSWAAFAEMKQTVKITGRTQFDSYYRRSQRVTATYASEQEQR